MTGDIQPVLPGKLVGPAVTVLEDPSQTSEPPTHALRAIDESDAGIFRAAQQPDGTWLQAGRQSVNCIAAGGADVAVWGGLMAAGVVANKIAGAVLDARVRDVEEIRRDHPDRPIYARGSVPATTVGRIRTVSLNEPVEMGGMIVEPGDLIVADSYGLVCAPSLHLTEVLSAAQLIEQREREQTRLIHETGSLQTALAKYNRV